MDVGPENWANRLTIVALSMVKKLEDLCLLASDSKTLSTKRWLEIVKNSDQFERIKMEKTGVNCP